MYIKNYWYIDFLYEIQYISALLNTMNDRVATP